jgi:P27 family predicted phage terminase small subunit
MRTKLALKVVKPTRTGNNPPRTLGKVGFALWQRITNEYAVEDAAGKELLALACEALDRAEACRAAIDRDGEVQRGGNGFSKEHPALRPELASRAFVAKMLLRLGLDVEPMRQGQGRPPGVQWPRNEE